MKIRNRDRDHSFFDYPPTYAADEFDAVTESRPSRVRVICIALAVTAALGLLALPALAIPGSTQNPDGSWTGPNGEDLGGGNPPSKPEPRHSHEGEPTGVMRCGCGYVVILRDGQSKAAAERACEAAVPAKKECAK